MGPTDDMLRALLSREDYNLATDLIADKETGTIYRPDLIIAPDGKPYLYRWYITPHELQTKGQVYFHIQVASDPERPLHDHPWDNTSVILSGGYDEMWSPYPSFHKGQSDEIRKLRAGDMVFRKATEAHRLILPEGVPYTMTLFTTGPKKRTWGFWFPDGWRPFNEVTEMTTDGRSVFKDGQNVT